MYMYSTHRLVNELLGALSAGVVYERSLVPDECVSVLNKIFSDKDDILAEYQRILHHMKRIGLIQREKLSDGHTYIMLSSKGKKRLKVALVSEISIQAQKKWDGKWRIVSFDIPREMRSRRYELLRELHRLGFEKVQQSMWVYPFPCEEEIKKITELLGIQDSIMLLEAKLDEINDKYLQKHFAYLIN